MAHKKISIAVISDLHCHGPQDLENGQLESYLIAGKPRVPIEQHPAQALVDLVKRSEIKADVIICCGDMANKASQIGLSTAYDILRADLLPTLGSKALLCTLGNHDVASRSSDPFAIAKNTHPDFPVSDPIAKNQFWAEGFCLQRFDDLVDFLILNTAHNHWNEALAETGTFEVSSISALDRYLTKESPAPVRIVVLHHHPILYPSSKLHSESILTTGATLVECLSKHGFKVIIHGHRHLPRVCRQIVGGNEILVFCAGSFSAMLTEDRSITRNVFHLCELIFDTHTRNIHGNIKTWEYSISEGWNPTTKRSSQLPHIANFGPLPSDNLGLVIANYCSSNKVEYLDKGCLMNIAPSLDYLLPDESDKLSKELETNHNLRLIYDGNEFLGVWRLPNG